MASEFERLQAALPKRYTLLRELDVGGMSRVYLAREALPDRDVAIKVFDEQLSARLGRERFVREVEVTSKLSHPHIVPLYAAGEADGTLYYVMPFIGGESLRDRLAREGRLPIADAIRITHQIADALQHAHDKDVIHRDIKPANILFQSGHAVVADFGIARALRAAKTGELTVAGLSVGTPDYMSPEQAGGEGQIDGRTDTYALACVLYEMLGGQPPFLSRSPQATLARHLTDSMPSLRSIRDSVSIDVEATIRKALSKAPADRHATTMDFANELQAIESGGYAAPVAAKSPPGRRDLLGLSVRIAGTLLVVAAIGLAYSAWSSRDPAPAAAAPSASRYVDSIAVMPFTNRTGDPALEGLGQSIADEVNRHLATVSEVKVIATYSVVSLWNSGLGFARLMDSLKVGHLIDGYYEMRGGELVVMVEEIDPAGVVENVTTYTIDPAKLDSAQLAVAHVVSEQFLASIGLVAPPEGPDVAYGPGRGAYIQGTLWLGQRTPIAMRRAVTQFNEAIRLEETYAPAHAALSSAYALSLYYKYDVGLPAYDLAALAFAEADRAIELDPELDAGYSSRGYITGLVGADVDAAQADFDRAAQLAPNNPNAPSWSSRVLVQRGLIAEAYEQARRARDLDPLAAGRRMALLSVAFQLHDYDVVIEESRAAIQLQPELVIAISFEARALALTRRGRACLGLELGVYDLVHALCLFTSGQETQAAALAAEAESELTSTGMPNTYYLDDLAMQDLASYYGLIGDAAGATRWVREAFQVSPTGIESKILDSELFDTVRDDPDFSAAVVEVRQAALIRIEAERQRLSAAAGN